MVFTEEKDYDMKKHNNNIFYIILILIIIIFLSSCKTGKESGNSITYYEKRNFKVYKPVSDKKARHKKIKQLKHNCQW